MKKRFYLTDNDKKIAGVCSGMAEYFDIDVTFIRIIFLATLFMGGWGFIAYILFWIVAPRKT
ncbi:PspC domain-containing protein [Elusimicrobiota bacterium]